VAAELATEIILQSKTAGLAAAVVIIQEMYQDVAVVGTIITIFTKGIREVVQATATQL
jgi:hypothetical protein